MKTTATQYAKALYQATAGLDQAKAKEAVGNFFRLLDSNNDLSKAGEILAEYEKVWRSENGVLKAELITASAAEDELVEQIGGYIKKASGAREIEWQKTKDPSIIGGMIVRYQDKVINASLKQRVSDLKNKMIS